jgi:catechol 2,3-dioxygenase-like lactoylglutathione lyase family enzyme
LTEAGQRGEKHNEINYGDGSGQPSAQEIDAMIQSAEHFSFTVSNIETALHFFRDLLGLNATPVKEVESRDIQRVVGIPDAFLRISIVQVPGGANIELIEYVRPEGKKIDSKPCNAGIAHIAFLVDDVEATYRELTSKGVRFVNPPVWVPGNDGKGMWGVSYLKGPDDITIEVIEKQS